MIVLRRRRVRIHQVRDYPTIEGILVGSWDNHYRLLKPRISDRPGSSHDLAGHEYWVPRENVVFVEVLR